MYKILLSAIAILMMSGCSTKTEYNAVICEELKSDPTQVVPGECRVYDEAIAEKAYNKVEDEKKTSDSDIIEYKKEK